MEKLLRKLVLAMEAVRAIEPSLPISHLVAFLTIAAREEGDGRGVAQRDIEQALGLTQSSTSRAIAALSSTTYLQTTGPNLVESFQDGDDRRARRARLTPAGRRLRDQLLAHLE